MRYVNMKLKLGYYLRTSDFYKFFINFLYYAIQIFVICLAFSDNEKEAALFSGKILKKESSFK